MSKRSAQLALQKLEEFVVGNPRISIADQNKIIKLISTMCKYIKPEKTTTEKKRAPGTSQFDKKMLVSPEMCVFAGWEHGAMESRVEVTKNIWDYVKRQNLRDEGNKRIVILDDTLKALFKIQDNELKYPQIQKYIGQHLIKVESTQAPETQADKQ